MTVEQNHDAYEQGEASWAWPVYAFVAWLARIPGYVARFKPDWRDNWEDLRQSERLRDQRIAQGVAQRLAGHPRQLDDTKIQLIPPARSHPRAQSPLTSTSENVIPNGLSLTG